MKIKISELKQNPFKKYINDGKFDEHRLEILKESIDHGTLPEYFIARKFNGAYQLTSGHHRLEALKQVKGIGYSVDVSLVDFSDEQMLVDMVRENITQRDTDFRDTNESVVLARSWLQSKVTGVNQFNTVLKQQRKNNGTFDSSPDSYRSIASFLSKNGKTICYNTVKNHLDIFDKLPDDVYELVRKNDTGKDDENHIGIKEAVVLAQFSDEKEQRDLLKVMKTSSEHNMEEQKKNITLYKNASDEIKQKVRNGSLDLADVENASLETDIKDFNKDNPRSEFIPNFAGRLKQFDKDVYILEKQVKAFSMVFHDKGFKERYATLKPKQKDSLNILIFNISGRVKKCYEEVEYFAKLLDIPNYKKIIMLEENKS
jgi:anti-sigma28 factor (negative regulator of flagellin synthesis)